MSGNKPNRGQIYCWRIIPIPDDQIQRMKDEYGESGGLGYYVQGFFTDPPHLSTRIRTSYVVRRYGALNDWIETRNSKYRLVGKEVKI